MSDCLIWWGPVSNRGYGRLTRRGFRGQAHRLIYEECFGGVDADTDVHHTCGTKLCVNPEHLLAVPHGGHTAIHNEVREYRTSDTCKRGHKKERVSPGGRLECRECDRIKHQLRRAA